jgi:hypothetical protein
VSQNNPFAAQGSTPSYVRLPPAWGSVDCDCLIPRFLWDQYGPKEIYIKMAKALVEFKFHHYDSISMEPSDYDVIPLCKIPYFVRDMGLLAE